jgi:hypothetical protein
LSSQGAAIRLNGRLNWDFAVEVSGHREAEVSEALSIIVDGQRAGSEEVG